MFIHLTITRVAYVMLSAGAITLAMVCPAAAESVTFTTTDDAGKAYQVSTKVTATGKPMLPAGQGKVAPHQMTATAEFEFLERRLPSGGRDALAFRAVRDFQSGRMRSVVAPIDSKDNRIPQAETAVELPENCRLIVAEGKMAGVSCYSPTTPMRREVMDLLELPGDPLALTALLPSTAVDVNGTWTPPEWAGQMLAAIEAIEKSTLTCTLTAATESTATIQVDGIVKGQRDGANCEVAVSGTMAYDRSLNTITVARLTYAVKSSIGAVSPGLDISMEVETRRAAAASVGRLEDKVVSAIPISAPAGAFDLVYDAAPWGVRLRYDRDWFFFKDTLDGTTQVAIFRLMEKGSILAQCNMSPIASASPGKHVPLEQFENDIKRSLGAMLISIRAKEQLSVDTGMKVFRVIADGKHVIQGPKGQIEIPTTWIYYLVAAPSGKQASFVFAVESKLVEQLNGRDETFVKGLQFVVERSAARP